MPQASIQSPWHSGAETPSAPILLPGQIRLWLGRRSQDPDELRNRALAEGLGLPRHALPRIRRGKNGKPCLDASLGVELGISHSGPLEAVALSRSGPIGVDIESLRPRQRLTGLAERCLSPADRAALEGNDVGGRLIRFHALWVLREAYTKCRGDKIFTAPRPDFCRSGVLDGGFDGRLYQLPSPSGPGHWLMLTQPDDACLLALCLYAKPSAVQLISV